MVVGLLQTDSAAIVWDEAAMVPRDQIQPRMVAVAGHRIVLDAFKRIKVESAKEICVTFQESVECIRPTVQAVSDLSNVSGPHRVLYDPGQALTVACFSAGHAHGTPGVHEGAAEW